MAKLADRIIEDRGEYTSVRDMPEFWRNVIKAGEERIAYRTTGTALNATLLLLAITECELL